ADPRSRAQILVRRAQGVIEYEDALGAALGFYQRFHLRVVNSADLVFVVKIGDLGVVMHKAEAVALQRKAVGVGPAIVQTHAVGVRFTTSGPRVDRARPADQGD